MIYKTKSFLGRKTKVSFDVPMYDYNRMCELAKKADKTLAAWVRDTILNIIGKINNPEPKLPDKSILIPPKPTIAVGQHPCQYLDRNAVLITPKRQDCQGTCTAPMKHGQPCFWAAPAATSCPYYARRR